MRLARIEADGSTCAALITDDGAINLSGRSKIDLPPTVGVAEVRALRDAAHAHASADVDYRLGEFTWLSPLGAATKVVCVGLNYRPHVDEVEFDEPDFPTLFTRFPDSLVGHEQSITRPHFSADFDYEGELAVVIGEPCYRCAAADVPRHILGYTLFNDASVRDWQLRTTQWAAGKNFYRSGSVGPWVVTADELNQIEESELTTRVNGEVRQQARVGDMIFPIDQLVSYVSSLTPLAVGDLIVTGTPGGVGMASDPTRYLADGDVVEVLATGVGTLVNEVASDS